MKLSIFTDGAARGNPGPAGIGVVLYNDRDEIVEQHCRFLGTATNNVAEYQALIAGLTLASKYAQSAPCTVRFFLDSLLVVEQMRGTYRVRDANLAVFAAKARELMTVFESVEFSHIPREKNKVADRLANQAIDEADPKAEHFEASQS